MYVIYLLRIFALPAIQYKWYFFANNDSNFLALKKAQYLKAVILYIFERHIHSWIVGNLVLSFQDNLMTGTYNFISVMAKVDFVFIFSLTFMKLEFQGKDRLIS